MSSDLMYRANDKEDWDAYALSSGLVTENGTPQGVYIDEIGPITITPAVYDEDGDEIEPAVIDARWHVNVRVLNSEFDMAALAEGNADVEWIDPDLVETPYRIWLGGMDYWYPSEPVPEPTE